MKLNPKILRENAEASRIAQDQYGKLLVFGEVRTRE